MLKAHDVSKEFVVITPEKDAIIEECNPELYQRLDARYDNFRGHELIATYEFKQDWPTWEVHPNGDEVVILLEGEVDVVLRVDNEDKVVTLSDAGGYVIVPKGVWHTAKIASFAKLLFITPGEGTENKTIAS